jgi:DNA-binding XRE family transcriptional regulator
MINKKYHGLDLRKTGFKIWNEMSKKNLTPDDIKESLGLTKQAIYKWRWGKSSPRLEHIVILAQILEVKIEDLLCIE